MLKVWVFRFFEGACLYAVISVVKSSEQTSFTAGVLKACNDSSLPHGAITLQTAQNFNPQFNHWNLKGLSGSTPAKKLFISKHFLSSKTPFKNMDGLSRLDKYWLKQENLQVHRRQNFPRVKTGLKWLNKQSRVEIVDYLLQRVPPE